ncbi:hypothetical protein [Rhodococcoides yunnanense]|uniref:hypothetical protein n=1 Tax=Rhodococcoides yunnanense TaxID=278209 RepID=UPI00157CE684|nr:hypothetical protein [Rhodococcus yunnanensis]
MVVSSRLSDSFGGGTGAPGGPPSERPAWFSSDRDYEAFLKTTKMDLGPQSITSTSIEVDHLDENDRRTLLGGYALQSTLEFVSRIFAQLDDAALNSRTNAWEKILVSMLTGEFSSKVVESVGKGNVLLPPAAVIQLIREAIEWCCITDAATTGTGNTNPIFGIDDFVLLMLSINGDQERQDLPDFFRTWPPTQDDLERYNAAMAVDDDMVRDEAQRQMLSDLARMQANATTVPDVLLGDAYDTWFKKWPELAPHDLIGDTAIEAFEHATGVSLTEFIKLGLQLWTRTKTGAVTLNAIDFAQSADSQAVTLMKTAASLTVQEYRKRLKAERKKGLLAHRRYTFAERPLIRFGDDEYVALRPVWVLDRLCGSQLYWQTFFAFGTEKDPRGEQFSLASNYVFEDTIGYLLRRATRRARPTIKLITEREMQQAWKQRGDKPSVCDWVLASGKYCLLVDATNHWLDEKAAQGFADAEDYTADLEDTFVRRKFLQLKSTIELLAQRGWEGRTFDEQTVFVPMVVVPNGGIPPNVLSDVDLKLRSHSVLGELGRFVTSPGILTYSELQVFEGVCEHRGPQLFVEILARWRVMCTGGMPVRPQTFLDISEVDRPMGKYPTIARSMLMQRL